jgi:N utilization substance protein B
VPDRAKPSRAFESRSRARRRALQAIYQWQITGQEADEVLTQFRAAQDLVGVDVAHFETLVRGVIAEQQSLDEELQPFLDRPVGQLDLMERVILRLGSFELIHCPDLPYRVVLDECVDLAHRFGATQGHSYVNAVLDKAARRWRAAEAGQAADSGPNA